MTMVKMDDVSWKNIVWSPLLQIVILSLGVLVSFLVSFYRGDVTIYLPFMSETGAIVPEMGIFSMTVIFGSFIGVIVVFFRYMVVIYMLEKENERLHKVNSLGLIAGVVSFAGLAGVGAFPMSTILVVHLITAGIHFALAVFYLFLQSYLSFKVKSDHQHIGMSRFRVILTILMLLFLVLLVICMPIAHFNWLSWHKKPHALKTPEDRGYTMLFASALFEWLLYISFLTYFVTFVPEFRKFELVLSVRPREDMNHNPKSTNVEWVRDGPDDV